MSLSLIAPVESLESAEDSHSYDPPEDTECYLGMHYKVLSITARSITLRLWNRLVQEWSDASIPLHPKSTRDQQTKLIHNLIADTTRAHAAAEQAIRNHPSNYRRG